MADKYKTGENAPESGKFKVEGLVNGNSHNDDTVIDIEKGEQFPPSSSSREAAYWVKA
ncbi:YjzC family protein [Bacillus sp. SD088]|uniref:YjzC family protein n=1 Tax=Bacillus sp. SD088 TaxID=2782012 RepID=UPI001A972C43|nr:YjzC family protein [Bacillus sp. SD088]MBO0991459.1 YjzC family protein [Bacillus sp. SD088]